MVRKEKGKNSTAIAIPFRAPNCSRASSRLPVKTARHPGTMTFSRVRRVLPTYRVAATGAPMLQRRRSTPLAGTFFPLPGTWRRSRR